MAESEDKNVPENMEPQQEEQKEDQPEKAHVRVAIAGCTHGEMDQMYWDVEQMQARDGVKIDLIICCGDFQAIRNYGDLQCMAVPPKYRQLQTFYKYYSGEKVAPILTIFVGGNHESSGYLAELPNGGWVAPNIYYMGYAGVLNFRGLKIAGLSGIFKGYNYDKGHYECPPYRDDEMRSAYHVRSTEVFRLKQMEKPHGSDIDIMISHDWPNGVVKHGDVNWLLRVKKHFRQDVERDSLGNPYTIKLLNLLKPRYWFAAHLHVKFPAEIAHPDGKVTRFLALDKCLPRRGYLQVMKFEVPEGRDPDQPLSFDHDWISILRSTDHLTNLTPRKMYMPGPGGSDNHDFKPTDVERQAVESDFDNNLKVPSNFCHTAAVHTEGSSRKRVQQTPFYLNPQTEWFCDKAKISNINSLLYHRIPVELRSNANVASTSNEPLPKDSEMFVISRERNPDEIDLGDLDEVEEGNEANEVAEGNGAIEGEEGKETPECLENFTAPPIKRTLEEEDNGKPPPPAEGSAIAKFKRRNLSQLEDDA